MYSPEGVLVLRSGDFSPSPRTPAKWPPTAARRPLRCAKWPPPKAERPPRPEGSPRTTAKWPPPKIGRPPRPEGSPRTPARQRSACLTEGACLIEGASTAFPTEFHTEFPTDDFTECTPSTKTNSDQNHNNKKVIQQNTNNILLGSAPLPVPSPLQTTPVGFFFISLHYCSSPGLGALYEALLANGGFYYRRLL